MYIQYIYIYLYYIHIYIYLQYVYVYLKVHVYIYIYICINDIDRSPKWLNFSGSWAHVVSNLYGWMKSNDQFAKRFWLSQMDMDQDFRSRGSTEHVSAQVWPAMNPWEYALEHSESPWSKLWIVTCRWLVDVIGVGTKKYSSKMWKKISWILFFRMSHTHTIFPETIGLSPLTPRIYHCHIAPNKSSARWNPHSGNELFVTYPRVNWHKPCQSPGFFVETNPGSTWIFLRV